LILLLLLLPVFFLFVDVNVDALLEKLCLSLRPALLLVVA
jgi:hypothetical protein